MNSITLKENIAFAKGGAHLPIAHALRLLSTHELRFGLTRLKLRRKKIFLCYFGGGKFFLKGEGQLFLKFLSQVFSLQDEIEERKIKFGRWILGGGAIFVVFRRK